MRIALITLDRLAEEADGEGASGTPARLAGQPIAWHQLHAALALECERIVCLAPEPVAEVAALQREAERRGAKFHAVWRARMLSGLVAAADTLFVFAPGILPDREWLHDALSGRAGIGVFAAERAVPWGFERIDRDRAWAGVLATRGDAVEALADLPPDADPSAGLLRIALQRGTRCVEVPDQWLDEGRWATLSDAKVAARFEPLWYARGVPEPGPARPSDTLAYRTARWLTRSIARRPQLPVALTAASGLLTAGGATTGYFGYSAIGLAMLAVAAFIASTGTALDAFAAAGSGIAPKRWPIAARDAALDLALIACAASPAAFGDWSAPFAAAVIVAAMRLAREDVAPSLLRPFGDRVLVLSVAAVLAAASIFAPGIALLSVAALGLRLLAPSAQLTRA
ncbi:hypothetical protein [Tsuneonella amylolytica]|uniref:hypothetical protein n=1 Tax=Tsuneonella amylolytica TaxID=2338327 RepID=UPI000EA97D5E|nr:hypothetical protein [Tsuneonella amylolytica]